MSQQAVELVQIVVSIDGALYSVPVPSDRQHLALKLISSVFDDGQLAVRRLPSSLQKVKLSDLAS